MKCPVCGAAELVHDTRDQSYTYKGEITVLSAVTGDFCTACGESILNSDESRRTMDMMLEFHKQVNAAIIDPAFKCRFGPYYIACGKFTCSCTKQSNVKPYPRCLLCRVVPVYQILFPVLKPYPQALQLHFQ